MAKLIVSMATYGEIHQALEKIGQSVNDGKPLVIEQGTALMPPYDFRLVAVRQNCLEAASTAYIPPVNQKDFQTQDDQRFIQFCETIFQWCLNGVDSSKKETKVEPIKPKIVKQEPPNKSGW